MPNTTLQDIVDFLRANNIDKAESDPRPTHFVLVTPGMIETIKEGGEEADKIIEWIETEAPRFSVEPSYARAAAMARLGVVSRETFRDMVTNKYPADLDIVMTSPDAVEMIRYSPTEQYHFLPWQKELIDPIDNNNPDNPPDNA